MRFHSSTIGDNPHVAVSLRETTRPVVEPVLSKTTQLLQALITRSVMVTLSATSVLVCGCGAEQATFSHRAELDELIPEVQDHINTTVDSHFGTPVDMVAWERLPIRFHAAKGTVVGIDEAAQDRPNSHLFVNLTTENLPVTEGQRLTFTSGQFLGAEDGFVESFEPDNQLLTIEGPGYEPPPAEGDRFVIGAGEVLEQGRVLYAEHCQHCHGVAGDGNGPTARYLNPKPRDYRLGKFKFTSTNTSDRAAREDLATTIEDGIPGTYMPSFKLLTKEELQALVEYVLWLSMRGEIEYRQVQTFKNDYSKESVDAAVADAVADGDGVSRSDARQQIIDELNEYLAGDWQEEFNDDTKFLAEQWRNGQEETAQVIPKEARVADTPESREEGRRLYLSAKAKCATCHGPQGLGDGGQTISVQKDPTTNSEYPLPGLYDDWGNPLIPRNLTQGIYRGGRRPIDLYRRIYSGIKGTPMPAFGTVLSDKEIWDIVNYVMSIPYESRDHRPGEGALETIAEPTEVAAHDAAVADPDDATTTDISN